MNNDNVTQLTDRTYNFFVSPIISINKFRRFIETDQINDDMRTIMDSSSETVKNIYKKWSNKDSGLESINPYMNYDFTDRLNVDKLYLSVTDREVCDTDSEELEKIQVVVQYKARHSYGLITGCCRKCKRLFMTKSDYDEYQRIFENKGIKCEAILLEGNDEKE